MDRRGIIPVLLAILACTSADFAAQPNAAEPAEATSGPGPTLPGTEPSPGGSVKPTPALPGEKTEADTFREMLAMSPSERTQALADRTDHQRAYLQRKLREYEELPRDQREARLQQLDLACHLDRLMRLPPERRAERLVNVPPAIRPLVDERLRQWDLLPRNVQQSVLEHETTANYFLRVRPASPPPASASAHSFDPERANEGERTVRIKEPFNLFFQLPPKERRKTLETLPPAERDDMEKALKVFANLSPEQRQSCIDSFEKFRRMSKGQRDQFLKNAARWQAMSPQERETWRSLIKILPPSPSAGAPGLPTDSDRLGKPVAISNLPVFNAVP